MIEKGTFSGASNSERVKPTDMLSIINNIAKEKGIRLTMGPSYIRMVAKNADIVTKNIQVIRSKNGIFKEGEWCQNGNIG